MFIPVKPMHCSTTPVSSLRALLQQATFSLHPAWSLHSPFVSQFTAVPCVTRAPEISAPSSTISHPSQILASHLLVTSKGTYKRVQLLHVKMGIVANHKVFKSPQPDEECTSLFLQESSFVWVWVSQTFSKCLWKSAKHYICREHVVVSIRHLAAVPGTVILLWIWPQITLISSQIRSCESNWFFTSLVKLKKRIKNYRGYVKLVDQTLILLWTGKLIYLFFCIKCEAFWKENIRIQNGKSKPHYLLEFSFSKMMQLFCYFTEFCRQIQWLQNDIFIFFF